MIATADAGAVVGGWQTRVHAVDMWTVGLGGDSKITQEPDGSFRIGPRRAVPLCTAAAAHPELVAALEEMLLEGGRKQADWSLDFYTLVKRPAFELSRHEQMLLDLLDGKVLHKSRLNREIGPFVALERFVELGLVAEVSFTPTDLSHAQGSWQLWRGDAALFGICLLARGAGMAVAELTELLQGEITSTLTVQLGAKALHQDDGIARGWSAGNELFLRRLLKLTGSEGVRAALSLEQPVVAVGAPVRAYFPAAVAPLGAGLVIPEHAEVANAYGAVTGRVLEKCELHVRPARPEGFTVVAAGVQRGCATLSEALGFARKYAADAARTEAERRGGEEVVVTVEEEEQSLPLRAGWGDRVLIEVRVCATALGKPRSFPASS